MYQHQRGDYLGGGYQRGDFLGIGKFVKNVAGRIISGSPVGQLVQAVIGVGTTIIRGQETLPQPGMVAGPSGFQAIPQGQTTTVATKGGTSQVVQQTNGCEGAPRGKHLNKSGYWTKEGFVPPGSKWVTNRTMNVGNAKALRRSIRREQGFVKLAQRSLKGTGYKIARR